jgi:histidine triad (HIT) family protein
MSSDSEDGFTPMPYDHSNIFAKILSGDIPCVKIYEDDKTIAFLDVMPQAPGHTLVLPKETAENIFDLSQEGAAALITTVQKVAKAVKIATAAPGLMLVQLNGKAAGQSVFHIHMHIIPRQHGIDLEFHERNMVPAAELEPIAAKIRAAL